MEVEEPCPNNNIIHNSNVPKIYRPKPRKLCVSYNSFKKFHNNKNKTNNKHYPLSPSMNACFNFKKNLNNNGENKNEFKNNNKKRPKLDFEEISLEEIEKDFNKLKARSEVIKVEKELLYLLRNSTKDNSVDDNCKDSLKIKRPKNPFLENLE